MNGKPLIAIEHIRSLAIQCHALDTQFDELFNSETVCGLSDSIHTTFKGLYSVNILNLAISLRVGLSKEEKYKESNSEILCCGFLDDASSFSIKDVCDKIIHADTIDKPIERGAKKSCVKLQGKLHGKTWEFDFSLSLFCEFILKWLDEIEKGSNAQFT